MGTEKPHDRLIASAAKDTLGTHGFRRRGRSRLWFADYEWWLIVVEFQPGGWSRGTYLNIAAKWLWANFPHWSFDFSFEPGPRVGCFQEFKNEEQFRVATQDLANVALAESIRLRDAFPAISVVSDILATRASGRGTVWDLYHAAVAASLADHVAEAQRLFSQLSVASPNDPPTASWLRELRTTAAMFASLAGDRRSMREAILDQIQHSRTALRLPEIDVRLP
jgi:hypothetical protein